MTRFARAKGSKASNERIPEPATPWHEMKNQLMSKYHEQEASEKKVEADERRTKTYQNFLKEKQEEDAKNVKWAEFPGVEKNSKQGLKEKRNIKNGFVGKQGKRSKNTEDVDSDDDDDVEFQALKHKLEQKLKEQFDKGESSSDDEAPQEVSAKIKPKEPVIKKQTTKKEKLSISVNGNTAEEETPEEAAKRKAEKKLERRKQQKLKKREALQGKPLEELTEVQQAKVEKLQQKLLARREKRREVKEKRKAEKAAKAAQQPTQLIKPLEELTEEERAKREKNKEKALARKQKLKEKKKLEEAKKTNQKKPLEEMTEEERAKVEKHRRKKLAQKEKRDRFKQEKKDSEEATKKTFEKSKNNDSRRKPSQFENVKINGQEVQLARYNGFPVRKEDYDRLVALEKEMRIKGVPRDEIKRAMKLEQRRAEKALARLKKKVCFHCRGPGHNLSECPLLDDQNQHESISSGICFKCGSTEHTHFNCRVVRGDEYKFATCFICKEQGHISRQCPDNNRGLYPQGGACRVCGDVTHLKKDCPRYQAQQEQSTVLAETMANGNVEGLEDEVKSASPKKKKFNKIIKF